MLDAAGNDEELTGPYDASVVERTFRVLRLAPDPKILDVGCGKGQMLMRAVELFDGKGTGVDLDLGEARERLRRRGMQERIELMEGDANELTVGHGFDLTMCVGATHVFGGYEQTLNRLLEMTMPGGHLIVGEGYWEREPSDDALRILGASRDELGSLAGLVNLAVSHGLTPLTMHTSDQQQWDEYEFSWARGLTDYAAGHSDDSEVTEMQELAAGHLAGYLNGYRGLLGFAIVACQVPLGSPTPARV